MLKRIWIPQWLYQGLPWAAVIIGCVGVLSATAGWALIAMSMAVGGYGAAILVQRATYSGVYHHG